MYMPQGHPKGQRAQEAHLPPTLAHSVSSGRAPALNAKRNHPACYGFKAVAQGRPEGVFAPCSTALGPTRPQPKPKGAEQGWARALPYPVTGGTPCRAGPASLFGGRALQHSNQPRCAVPPHPGNRGWLLSLRLASSSGLLLQSNHSHHGPSACMRSMHKWCPSLP